MVLQPIAKPSLTALPSPFLIGMCAPNRFEDILCMMTDFQGCNCSLESRDTAKMNLALVGLQWDSIFQHLKHTTFGG